MLNCSTSLGKRTQGVSAAVKTAAKISSISDPKKCIWDCETIEEFLGRNLWPLCGYWSLGNVHIECKDHAYWLEMDTMHQVDCDANGTFVVELVNDVIQVGFAEKIIKKTALLDSSLLMTVNLESACTKKDALLHDEYAHTASRQMLIGRLLSPWRDLNTRKFLIHAKK